MNPRNKGLMWWLSFLLTTLGSAKASIQLTNGDFQTGAPAANQADVVDWFDDSPSANNWWEGSWYGPTVSPYTSNKSCLGLSWMGGTSHWAYQSIGTNSEGINTLNLKLDVGSFTDAGGARNMGINVRVYQSDGTFTGADNTDIAGASGVTLIDQFSITSGNLNAGQVIAGLTGSLNLSATDPGKELFIRVSNYSTGTGEPWAAVDNLIIVYGVPTFTSQPQSYNGRVGETITLSAAADSDPSPTFQWQYSPNGVDSWSAISGANSASLVIPTVAYSAQGFYRVIASNSNSSATSDAAELSLSYPAPTIVQQPAAVTTIAGQSADFTVSASGLGNLTYQWYKYDAGGDIQLSGQTSSTLHLTNISSSDEGQYYVIVQDDAGVADEGGSTEALSSFASLLVADLSISVSTTAPTTDSADQYYLPGDIDDADNIDGTTNGTPNANAATNDASTYVAADRTSQGMTFTTGSNPQGYTLGAVTIRQVKLTTTSTGGTWYNIQNGDTFEFQFGSISGTAKTSIYSTTKAAYLGDTLVGNGSLGSGNYLTFNLGSAGIGTLAPNTTYYFEIAAENGDAFFELSGTSIDGYTGGTAFRGDSIGSIDSSYVALSGDRAFHVDLASIVGASGSYSAWIAGYPAVGSQTGFSDDPDHDGIPNGLESYFGTNPTSASSGISQLTKSGSTLSFTHPKNATAVTDVSAVYEWSTDLVTFHSAGSTAGGTTVTFSAVDNTPASGTTTVTATISGSVPEKLFVRLNATQVP